MDAKTNHRRVKRYLNEVLHPYEYPGQEVSIVHENYFQDGMADVFYYVGDEPLAKRLNLKEVEDYCLRD